jgi:hypothetical protein
MVLWQERFILPRSYISQKNEQYISILKLQRLFKNPAPEKSMKSFHTFKKRSIPVKSLVSEVSTCIIKV